MSKRKRAGLGKSPQDPEQPAAPAADDPPDDSSAKEDMVHVAPDMLAGSPDIFAPRSGRPEGAAPGPLPEAVAGPVDHQAPVEPRVEPAAASTALTPEPEVMPTAAPQPTTPPPAPFGPRGPYVQGVAHPQQPRRSSSSIALGVVLIVLGLFALAVVLFGIDLTQYGWPLFVIIPGLTLLVVGFIGLGPGASIPGGIITMLGLVLAYQSSTGDWASAAFAWALVAPFGVGLGMYLQALRDRDQTALRTGRGLMGIGALIFMVGFVFFESILGVSGREYGIFGKSALPILLIVIGLVLLVRSIQRSRRA